MVNAALKLYLSPEEYLEQEQHASIRHEYVDGEIYAMTGASERHNRIVMNIAFQLRSRARGSSCGVFVSDMKLRIQQGTNFYYPDVMLGCNPDDDHPIHKDMPCLIAEVLSPATEATDRREKLIAYKNIPQLQYYLVVSSDRRFVQYYQRNDKQEWEIHVLEIDETIHIRCQYGDGQLYEAGLCLDDIYEDVKWI